MPTSASSSRVGYVPLWGPFSLLLRGKAGNIFFLGASKAALPNQAFQLGGRFHVKAGNAGRECLTQFLGALANAGEHHVSGIDTDGQHAFQFTTGDDDICIDGRNK